MGRKFIVGGNWKAVSLAGFGKGCTVAAATCGERKKEVPRREKKKKTDEPTLILSPPPPSPQNGTKASIDTLLAEFAKADVPGDVGE